MLMLRTKLDTSFQEYEAAHRLRGGFVFVKLVKKDGYDRGDFSSEDQSAGEL